MILCVSASPALDLTYRVDRLVAGATNRVVDVQQRPGGKAINVARILHALGEDVQVLATAGGYSGAELAAALRAAGIRHELVPTAAATRRTVAIVDEAGGEVTMLNEPAVLDHWPAFLAAATAAIPVADVVVIGGRLPTGAPPDAFAELTRIAHSHDRPVVLDTSGPALRATLPARPTVVKPNADELRECTQEGDPVVAAHSLAAQWKVGVVASLGPDGLIAIDGDAAWRARPTTRLAGNPTGAGDAVVAGLARGLLAGRGLHATLADCVALAEAAVLAPSAGEIDLEHYRREAARVVVEPLARADR
jgi:tagatose 6-phosphate kinase